MTITMQIADGEAAYRVNFSLGPEVDAAVSSLLPLYRATGQVEADELIDRVARRIVRDICTEGVRELAEACRDHLHDTVAGVMGERR